MPQTVQRDRGLIELQERHNRISVENVRMTPFRTLRRATASMALEAAGEIFVITILCLLPLIGVAFAAYLHQEPYSGANHLATTSWRTFWDYLMDNVAKGQLAFYAISNWATVVWLCGREYKNHFPYRVALIVAAVSGFYYCGVLIDPARVVERAAPSVFWLSVFMYFASMVGYFLVALFSKIPAPSMDDTNNEEVSSLRARLRDLRGANG